MEPIYWLVDFPTYQYKEDVKALAAKNNLSIIDSRFTSSINPALVIGKEDAPKLTKARK